MQIQIRTKNFDTNKFDRGALGAIETFETRAIQIIDRNISAKPSFMTKYFANLQTERV